MEISIFLAVFLVVPLVIWLDWILANEFFGVAASKGYNDKKYLWYCFFFGLIGYLLVIALKDINTADKKDFELPEI